MHDAQWIRAEVAAYRDICGDPPLVAELSKLRQVRQTEADGGARDEGSAVLLVEWARPNPKTKTFKGQLNLMPLLAEGCRWWDAKESIEVCLDCLPIVLAEEDQFQKCDFNVVLIKSTLSP